MQPVQVTEEPLADEEILLLTSSAILFVVLFAFDRSLLRRRDGGLRGVSGAQAAAPAARLAPVQPDLEGARTQADRFRPMTAAALTDLLVRLHLMGPVLGMRSPRLKHAR